MKRIVLAFILCFVPMISYAQTAELSWTPNSETDLAGYKVYRGNGVCAIGALQPLIVNNVPVTVLVPSFTYSDTTVPKFDGDLCYEVTSFDIAGNESLHSIRATKTVNLVPPSVPVGLNIVVKP